jgi:hypothetical protein
MNRLEAELHRLFLSPGQSREDAAARALVLEVAGPGGWNELAKAWQGVQADLQLPAPGIAVSGSDAYQLWFSLAEPLPPAQALAFLEALKKRYLGEVPAQRIRTGPCAVPAARMPPVPPVQVAPGRWSAFVTVDLAAVFADEHWLDLPPTPDAQADVLSRLQCTPPAELLRAMERLASADAPETAGGAGDATASRQDPRSFLLDVMNDRSVALPLRIEAAKALLPCAGTQRP